MKAEKLRIDSYNLGRKQNSKFKHIEATQSQGGPNSRRSKPSARLLAQDLRARNSKNQAKSGKMTKPGNRGTWSWQAEKQVPLEGKELLRAAVMKPW